MRKTILPIVLLICSMWGREAMAQTVEGDKVLMGLKEILPSNWNMEIREGNLVVECLDSVWVMYNNKINAAPNSPTPKPVEGSRPNAMSRFIFHIEPKWDQAKKDQVEKQNAQIGDNLSALEAKHGVTDLKKMSRGRILYVPKTDADKKKIQAFLMAQREAESSIQPLPDYQTEQYALFQLAATGMESEYEDIFPEETNRQMYAISQFLRDNAKP